jgi:dephospho-CoA kinase
MTPLRIGLTGGVASGKSSAAAAFHALGVPVVDADRLAREVVERGQPALAAIAAAFGPEYLLPDGGLNRRRLRELVFADPERRRQLEAIVHPAVRAAEAASLAGADAPYVVVAIPLLAETGQSPRFDRVLVVDCPESLQKSRLMARDGSSAAEADAMLAAQASRAARLAIANDVLDNSGSLAELDASVRRLHARYLGLAADRGPVSG